jgi:hypothetical protein
MQIILFRLRPSLGTSISHFPNEEEEEKSDLKNFFSVWKKSFWATHSTRWSATHWHWFLLPLMMINSQSL